MSGTFSLRKAFFWILPFDCAISIFTKELHDHQGAWRDANTGEVLDLSQFWAPGQVGLGVIFIFIFLKTLLYPFTSSAKWGEGAKLRGYL